jgi:hypothetical protein
LKLAEIEKWQNKSSSFCDLVMSQFVFPMFSEFVLFRDVKYLQTSLYDIFPNPELLLFVNEADFNAGVFPGIAMNLNLLPM